MCALQHSLKLKTYSTLLNNILELTIEVLTQISLCLRKTSEVKSCSC